MPNGDDRNLVRLEWLCAAYYRKYRKWPTRARLRPIFLRDLAHVLDPGDFDTLATHLELHTAAHCFAVAGDEGELDYEANDATELAGPLPVAETEKWMGLRYRGATPPPR